jgi:hypothetical protein
LAGPIEAERQYLADSDIAPVGDASSKTAQLAELIAELGPDIPEISRRLGQFKESVRYRYKEKIVKRGMAVQAAVSHERLGLKRLIVVVDFSSSYRQYAQPILMAMNSLCYLISYSKTLPRGEYIVNFSVPAEYVDELKAFLNRMQSKGMFAKLEILDFDWVRHAPMKAKLYDFDTGRWEHDWSNTSGDGLDSVWYTPSTPAKYDYVDLLIIKELQLDANKSLKEISEKLKLNYKKLAWHYSAHVKARRMLQGFSINWIGTRFDYKIDKALHRKHRYFALHLLVRNINQNEMVSLRLSADRLPFLWAEAVGKNYYAEFAFPMDFIVDALHYLSGMTEAVRDRTELFTADQTESRTATIPCPLYDSTAKGWVFNAPMLNERFDNLIVQIGNGASQP